MRAFTKKTLKDEVLRGFWDFFCACNYKLGELWRENNVKREKEVPTANISSISDLLARVQ